MGEKVILKVFWGEKEEWGTRDRHGLLIVGLAAGAGKLRRFV